VNLRAKAWNVPNAGFKEAGKKYAALAGKMVVLEVRDKDHTLRAATDVEVAAWHEAKAQQRKVTLPPADLATRALKPLVEMTSADVKTYGTKTTNLGLIASARLPDVHVPIGFGVPFHYYVDHMKRNKLDQEVERIHKDPRFAADQAWRKAELEALRAKILKAPINPKTLDVVWAKVKKDLGGRGVFVRSSTNAEDLEGFNGAGLYDTVPNVKGRQALGEALRQCWSSLWNYTAVEERSFYGIDYRQVYFGVLVQVGVDATAAGVLVTRNLFDLEDDRSFTINAKRGLGLRVVGGTTVPEQIVYDPGNQGTKIVSRSDDPTMLVFDEKGGVKEVPNPNRGVILSEPRARALGTAVTRFIPIFSRKHPLDVEWLLEGEKVWIVQARPYVSKN
jgi:phosphoenolpyruvate synthase/pyruvate phosphate dikinase